MGKKIRADMILRQLEKRHTGGRVEDQFFTEVKSGPTLVQSRSGNSLMRMDAVAFKKSWTNPCITGYEVKVDRQDFLRDDKWPGYLKYCHRFSFACPKGLIAAEELPDEVGLVYYNPEKECLHTKRKAPYRMIEIPWEMLYYLVISRLDSDRHPFFSTQRDYLEAYIQDKDTRRDLGRQVNSKLIERLIKAEKMAKNLHREVEDLRDDKELLDMVREALKRHGIRTYKWALKEDLEKALSNWLPPDAVNRLERINKDVEELMSAVKGVS